MSALRKLPQIHVFSPAKHLKTTNSLNGHFSKDIQVATNCIKRGSTSLVFREMKIKTTRYSYIPTRRAIINKTDHKKYW